MCAPAARNRATEWLIWGANDRVAGRITHAEDHAPSRPHCSVRHGCGRPLEWNGGRPVSAGPTTDALRDIGFRQAPLAGRHLAGQLSGARAILRAVSFRE